MRILLTSGGTKVKIDEVRSITNMSRGTFGSAICKEFLENGHTVDFLMAEGSRSPFKYEAAYESYSQSEELESEFDEWIEFVKCYGVFYNQHIFKTFVDYETKLITLLKNNIYDIVILACAASDFGVDNYVNGKIRSADAMSIKLKPYPKLISMVKKIQPETHLVGFKLLVGSSDADLQAAAHDSIEKNGCDVVVANDLEDIKQDNHTLLIVRDRSTVRKEKETCTKDGTTLARELVSNIINGYNKMEVEIKAQLWKITVSGSVMGYVHGQSSVIYEVYIPEFDLVCNFYQENSNFFRANGRYDKRDKNDMSRTPPPVMVKEINFHRKLAERIDAMLLEKESVSKSFAHYFNVIPEVLEHYAKLEEEEKQRYADMQNRTTTYVCKESSSESLRDTL